MIDSSKSPELPEKSVLHRALECEAVFVERYTQIHEMRREYNRFIYQGPWLTATVSGVVLGIMAHTDAKELTRNQLLLAVLGLLVITGFAFVMGLWVLRSRVLLKALEDELIELESQMQHGVIRVYPKQVDPKLTNRFSRTSSTAAIVSFQFVLAAILALSTLIVALKWCDPFLQRAVTSLQNLFN